MSDIDKTIFELQCGIEQLNSELAMEKQRIDELVATIASLQDKLNNNR